MRQVIDPLEVDLTDPSILRWFCEQAVIEFEGFSNPNEPFHEQVPLRRCRSRDLMFTIDDIKSEKIHDPFNIG